jgi:large subunit ribosomal protein L21
MYAVINAGGKQERVEVGELIDVELLHASPGDELTLTPLLVVDGDDVTVSAEALAATSVTATVVGEVKGPKIVGFTYKSKSRQQRHYGHRQRYTTLEITGIGPGDSKAGDSKAGDSKATSAKASSSKAASSKAGDSKAGDSKAGDSKATSPKATRAKASSAKGASAAASDDAGTGDSVAASADDGAGTTEQD